VTAETTTWLLLIYIVPSEPTRLRATVWRELKKVGAVYLRDGVAVLPHREETLATFRAIASRIEEFGGKAILVENTALSRAYEEAIIAEARASRADEYAEIAREAEHFLVHAAREREHRDFTFAELEELEADLSKVRRWYEQVRARDYFATENAGSIDDLLARCDDALASFLEEASRHTEEVGP
jgi:hypothetical protein